jgi:hypothetical protein
MSAPPRKAAKPQVRPKRGSRVRRPATRRSAPTRAQAVSAVVPSAVPATASPARHHHDADDAALAAAVGAALVGPFVLAGAIGLRVLRRLARHGR